MATQTPNYGLEKPGLTDNVDIADFNGNADIIDAELKKKDFSTTDELIASTEIEVGDKVKTYGHSALGDDLGAEYEIVAAATGTHDDWNFIDLTGISGQAKLIQKDLTDSGYINGGFMLGKSSLLADYQYLAGDEKWYKLKSTTSSPYTHDTTDTPDTDFLEEITYKNLETEFSSNTELIYSVVNNGDGTYNLEGGFKFSDFKLLIFNGFLSTAPGNRFFGTCVISASRFISGYIAEPTSAGTYIRYSYVSDTSFSVVTNSLFTGDIFGIRK